MKEVIMKVPLFSADYPKAPIYIADLVRCKECKWHDTCCRNIFEDWRDATPTDIEYCSHGEREGE